MIHYYDKNIRQFLVKLYSFLSDNFTMSKITYDFTREIYVCSEVYCRKLTVEHNLVLSKEDLTEGTFVKNSFFCMCKNCEEPYTCDCECCQESSSRILILRTCDIDFPVLKYNKSYGL